MTQTNTTQNKEELIETIKLIFDRDLTAKQEFLLSKEVNKSLSQAHQSGIEEERKRIVDKFMKWIPLIAKMSENYIGLKNSKPGVIPYMRGFDKYLKHTFTNGVINELEMEDLALKENKQ